MSEVAQNIPQTQETAPARRQRKVMKYFLIFHINNSQSSDLEHSRPEEDVSDAREHGAEAGREAPGHD